LAKSGVVVIALILVVMCIPAVAIYAWQATMTEQADQGVEAAPTYVYGFRNSKLDDFGNPGVMSYTVAQLVKNVENSWVGTNSARRA